MSGATIELVKTGGAFYDSYRTLVVNAAPTQNLAHKLGLPPLAPSFLGNTYPYQDKNVSPDEVKNSDLFRYNLGRN